jgi:class 3 adenylate cyclase/peptidoglycan hydrolase-like protein with peptidoglycan-binding domain
MSSPTGESAPSARPPAGKPVVAHSRRLAAILHADLAGYVRLMAGAEDRTVSRLKSVRAEVWRPAVEAAGGRIVNIVADSVLAEFSSAVSAVAAAIDVQQRMARFNDGLEQEQRLMFRIGLHLGEVIVDETETIFGDAVNIAARIQLMAEPGGVAASAAIRDVTHLQIDCVFIDGGRRHAKNVGHSLRIYHVRTREIASRPLIRAASWIRRAGVTIWRPALGGTIAAAALLLVGSGYLAFTESREPVNSIVSNPPADARSKAEAEAAVLREAKEEAAKKTAADAAAKHQTDQALAIATANRTATAIPMLNEEARTVEGLLRLEQADRQRLQIALTSLGFDTRGDDGVFGPRSREMIANWQKAHNQRATGFMTSAQQQALLKEATTTLAKYDEQKKAGESVRPVAEVSRPPANRLPESADGLWRGTYECGRNANSVPFTLKPEIRLKGSTGTWYMAHPSWTNDQTLGISVSIDGTSVLITRQSVGSSANANRTPLSGRLVGNAIQASNNVCTVELIREASL